MTRLGNLQQLTYMGERDRILWRGNAEVKHETTQTIEIQFRPDGNVFNEAASQWVYRREVPSERRAACVTEIERLQWKYGRPKKVIVTEKDSEE